MVNTFTCKQANKSERAKNHNDEGGCVPAKANHVIDPPGSLPSSGDGHGSLIPSESSALANQTAIEINKKQRNPGRIGIFWAFFVLSARAPMFPDLPKSTQNLMRLYTDLKLSYGASAPRR